MNVVHVGKYYWPYSRGIETYLRLLCENLGSRVNLDVLVANDSRKTVYDTVNGIRVTRLGRVGELASTSFCLSLPSAIRRLKPDIVHVHLPNPWAELSYYLAGCPGKLVVSFHSDIIRQRFLLQLHKPLHRSFLKRADAIIAATPAHISHSPFLSCLDPGKCHVIPYGIDVNAYVSTADIAAHAEKLKNELGVPLILFVGHLVYYKGVDILLKALVKTNAHLAVVGTGPLAQQLASRASSLSLDARVHFLGSVDQETLVALYHACDIFCLPSTVRSEAFGIVQLEAFAAGKPVISTALPSGVPWVNRDGVSGLVVPPGNPDALADGINTLLTNDDLCIKLGKGAYQRVTGYFTADRMADETLAIYRTLIPES
jgi:rhamnosyl/mannosyltransferase